MTRGRKPQVIGDHPNTTYGVPAAAKVAGVSRRTIYKWIDSGHISLDSSANEMAYLDGRPVFNTDHLRMLGRFAAIRRAKIEEGRRAHTSSGILLDKGAILELQGSGKKVKTNRSGVLTLEQERESFEWPEDLPLTMDEVTPPVSELTSS